MNSSKGYTADELIAKYGYFTGTLSKAEAQALMDAHDIQALLDREDIQVLIQDNPILTQAYTTVGLIAKYGKP